jgi:hypothetical protein
LVGMSPIGSSKVAAVAGVTPAAGFGTISNAGDRFNSGLLPDKERDDRKMTVDMLASLSKTGNRPTEWVTGHGGHSSGWTHSLDDKLLEGGFEHISNHGGSTANNSVESRKTFDNNFTEWLKLKNQEIDRNEEHTASNMDKVAEEKKRFFGVEESSDDDKDFGSGKEYVTGSGKTQGGSRFDGTEFTNIGSGNIGFSFDATKKGTLTVDGDNVEMFKSLGSTKSRVGLGGSGVKFRIVCIGDLMARRYGDVCFGMIVHGPTFCIRKGCKTTHVGDKVQLGPNMICVIKLHDVSLFYEPTVPKEKVGASLFSEWMNDKVTLEEWSHRFAIAAASSEALDGDMFKETEAFQEMARRFKTPIKSAEKAPEAEVDEMLQFMATENLYKRKITSFAEFEKIKDNDSTFLAKVIHNIEEKLEEVSRKTTLRDAISELVSK